MSDSVQPYEQQPSRLLCPQDSPGKNTGVGCHFLLPKYNGDICKGRGDFAGGGDPVSPVKRYSEPEGK